MEWQDITLRLAAATLLGSVIGVERQWRSHYVGLRTNSLVCIGSAALIILGLMLPPGDVSGLGRMASQIVTGVGFLCAGVIFHEGITARGFNTAATLWCSTAVGMFAGMGLFTPAVILAGFITLVNLFLRPLVQLINKRAAPDKPELPDDNLE